MCTYGFILKGSDTIFPNVYVAGVNVGGLKRDAAINAVTLAVEQETATDTLTVVLPDRTIDFTPEITNVALNPDEAADAAMNYGRDGGPIKALIGPAICGRCYEVPADMADESEILMPGIRSVTSWDTPALDLPRAAAAALGARGVRVDIDERCTLEDADLFSYRADSSCGRQALIIVPA